MKRLLLFVACGLCLAPLSLDGDSYAAKQCPKFATTEQPYFYLYTGTNFLGDPLYVTNASVPNLGAVPKAAGHSSYFDNRAASVRLRGKWRICTDPAYGGVCADVQSRDWKSERMVASLAAELGADFENSVSSVKLVSCTQY